MDDSDEDFFSDDGFDSLPLGTLLQLEQHAFQATQAQKAHQTQNEVAKPLQNQPTGFRQLDSIATTAEQPLHSGPSLKPPELHPGLSNEYGDIDVGELDAEVFDNGHDPIPALQQGRAFAEELGQDHDHLMEGLQLHGGSARQVPTERMEIEEDYVLDDTDGNGIIYEQPSDRMEELMIRIQELTRQNETVMQELDAAKSNALTKAGEISIIRANQAKLAENYDRQLSALRKSLAEEAAKYKAELEAARVESKTLATENAFLKQDLAEEALRINNLKAKSKSDEKGQPMTPKKTRVLPFRDGFDDDEIAVFSPSKSSGVRSKRGSPAVPGKRKRKPSQDSPIPMGSLQMSPSRHISVEELAPETEPEAIVGTEDQVIPRKDDRNLKFMKLILNHRTPPNKDRDLEVMMKLAFPSEPERMFSTIVLEATSSLSSDNYPVQFAQCIISLWSRALKEKFYKPIYMFMEIVKFILLLDTSSVAPGLIEELLPILQESGDINGVPRFQHSPVSRQNLGQFKQTPQSELNHEINSTEVLNMLYLVASGCLQDEKVMETFWTYIRYDFILMMLNCSQPISDIIIILNLLSLSLRHDSFGPVQETEKDQISNENYIIDRVANLLSEMPQVDEGQEPYTQWQICNMRLEALSFLNAVAFSASDPANNHGSSVIAAHPTALARLIRSMHDEVDALYCYTLEHELHNSLVNGLMRLIYGVTRNHKDIDLHSKLHLVAGGKQKYLVVLTRLAFSEGPVLEAGISDETVEMAHEMLEDAVNPQEAEALLEAFPTAARRDDS